MPTWNIDINIQFTVDSDDIANFPRWDNERNFIGPRGQINAERQFLEELLRRNPDHAIAYYLSLIATTNNNRARFRAPGPPIDSGTDGRLLTTASEFRSQSVSLTNAMVDKILFIDNTNPPASRGFYKIIARNGPNSVTLDGIVATGFTNLNFSIHDPGELLVTLTDLNPV